MSWFIREMKVQALLADLVQSCGNSQKRRTQLTRHKARDIFSWRGENLPGVYSQLGSADVVPFQMMRPWQSQEIEGKTYSISLTRRNPTQ